MGLSERITQVSNSYAYYGFEADSFQILDIPSFAMISDPA